jgi:catechol 2,3-dioxygenase-like lactoylglutathione lyase family enzyme
MTADHINRYVSDIDAIISFYADALGFTLLDRGVKRDGHRYAILKCGGLEMFISEKTGYAFEDCVNFRHLGLSVDNAEALLSELKTKGYAPLETRLVVKAFSRQFYFKDPDGFELDFIEWTDRTGLTSTARKTSPPMQRP